MDAPDNKQTVETMLKALAAGDGETYFGYLADEVRHTLIGTTRFSGTYEGKEDVVTRFFGAVMSELDLNVFEVEIDRIIADDEYAVAQFRGKMRTKSGNDYNNTYCFVYRIVDGKVQESWEYVDTELVTAAFGPPQQTTGAASATGAVVS